MTRAEQITIAKRMREAGCTYREIGAHLGINPMTAKARTESKIPTPRILNQAQIRWRDACRTLIRLMCASGKMVIEDEDLKRWAGVAE